MLRHKYYFRTHKIQFTNQKLDVQRRGHLLVFSELRWEMIVHFVDDGGIVDGIPGFYVLINGCTYINKRLKNLHSFPSTQKDRISSQKWITKKKQTNKTKQTNMNNAGSKCWEWFRRCTYLGLMSITSGSIEI